MFPKLILFLISTRHFVVVVVVVVIVKLVCKNLNLMLVTYEPRHGKMGLRDKFGNFGIL